MQLVRLAVEAPPPRLGHRRNRIDHDAVPGTFQCQHIDQAERGQLAHRIGGKAALCVLRIQRAIGGGNDDAATTRRAHCRPHCLCQPQGRLRGQAQYPLHRIVFDGFQRLVLHPASVVDQEVDVAMLLQQILHQRVATGTMIDGITDGLHR
ncbi:hypothetical protein G6F24_015065 [Rhizopus arrhizus]|nr:hypothetical protein G6F24_015065 [Rhizopus arrhizus]